MFKAQNIKRIKIENICKMFKKRGKNRDEMLEMWQDCSGRGRMIERIFERKGWNKIQFHTIIPMELWLI